MNVPRYDDEVYLNFVRTQEAKAHRAGWDKVATLYLVHHAADPSIHRLKTVEIPLDPIRDVAATRGIDNEPDILRMLTADTQFFVDQNGRPPQFTGMLYIAEAYGLSSNLPNAEHHRRTRTNHLHPDHVEVRMALLTTVHGWNYLGRRERGDAECVVRMEDAGWHYSGPVLKGLLDLMRVFAPPNPLFKS